MTCMKFILIISVDVNQSFSRYKSTLADNRQRFIFENIKQYSIIPCHNETQSKNTSVPTKMYINFAEIILRVERR